MMKTSNISTVRQLTIAALLGAMPGALSAQKPRTSDETSETMSPDNIRVAARPIARGTVLTAEDIAYERKLNPAGRVTPHSVAAIDMDHRAAPATDPLVGWTARRMIATGEPLRAPAIVSPRLVASGELVDVIWRDGSIVVTAKGRATRAGGAGERISVRIDAQRTVEGLVVAAGQVRVD